MIPDGVIFRVIPEYPRYMAGSDGHVYTTHGSPTAAPQWRRLASTPNSHSGYLVTSVAAGRGNRKWRKVHILIASAWHGPRPTHLETRHLDGDKTNNRPDNLAYGTRAENTADRVAHGRLPFGERQHSCHVPDAGVDLALQMAADGATQRAIAAAIGVCQTTVGTWLRGTKRTRRSDGTPWCHPQVKERVSP